jgi:hypothetical protein
MGFSCGKPASAYSVGMQGLRARGSASACDPKIQPAMARYRARAPLQDVFGARRSRRTFSYAPIALAVYAFGDSNVGRRSYNHIRCSSAPQNNPPTFSFHLCGHGVEPIDHSQNDCTPRHSYSHFRFAALLQPLGAPLSGTLVSRTFSPRNSTIHTPFSAILGDCGKVHTSIPHGPQPCAARNPVFRRNGATHQ